SRSVRRSPAVGGRWGAGSWDDFSPTLAPSAGWSPAPRGSSGAPPPWAVRAAAVQALPGAGAPSGPEPPSTGMGWVLPVPSPWPAVAAAAPAPPAAAPPAAAPATEPPRGAPSTADGLAQTASVPIALSSRLTVAGPRPTPAHSLALV